MSIKDGPGEGTWSVFAEKVVAERDAAREEVARLRKALDAVMDACDAECYACGAYYVAKKALDDKKENQ